MSFPHLSNDRFKTFLWNAKSIRPQAALSTVVITILGLLTGELKNMVPRIADFGLSTRLGHPSLVDHIEREQLGIYPIQPDHYRAPEVILGCGWDSSADI